MKKILEENDRRNAVLAAAAQYDPLTGAGGCGERVWVDTPVDGLPRAHVPVSMARELAARPVGGADEWKRLRCRHDFEYWCAVCVTIKPKTGWKDVPFVLNGPQRRIAAMLEEDRRANRPLRLIVLKARQWGGSTLVQMYMAWIQLVHRRNWHSLICGNTKDVANTIRGMYTKLLNRYPPELFDGDGEPRLLPFERAANTRVVAGRDNRITLGSAESQDAVRGQDYAMAHLSEVAFWPATPRQNPDDFVRAICGSIACEPMTLVVMESTANGVGNYFHAEWMRNSRGDGDKRCVFVPWYEIEHYRLPLCPGALSDDVAQEFYDSMDAAERALWADGRTLEMINWYRHKRREYATAAQMQAEFPGTADEAFANSASGVFDTAAVQRLRRGCTAPVARGEVSAVTQRFAEDALGCLSVWEWPAEGARYVAAVDIGGRSARADWSVIAVLTREKTPRVVAQWRGHIDHDLLGQRIIDIGRFYNNALLVVESNSLESGADALDHHLGVLERLCRNYPCVYMRAPTRADGGTWRPGFHTNRRTKPLLVHTLIGAVRDALYVERDNMACDELLWYAELPNGAYAARPGKHDDILMTRALALYAIADDTSADGAETATLAGQPLWL